MKSTWDYLVDDMDLGYGAGLLALLVACLAGIIQLWWLAAPLLIAAFILCWWFG